MRLDAHEHHVKEIHHLKMKLADCFMQNNIKFRGIPESVKARWIQNTDNLGFVPHFLPVTHGKGVPLSHPLAPETWCPKRTKNTGS